MKRVKKNKAEFREWVRSLYQGRACERCGFSDPRALDFHHRDPSTKLFAVARAPTEKGSKATVLAEVAKCIVLCANCHRIEHHSP